MPNIILNSYCNRNCVYCFAKKKNQGPYKQLTLDNLITICDFFENSGQKKLTLLGGEPSLHPEFLLFLEYLISRAFSLSIFSNGMISPTVVSGILDLIKEWDLDDKRLRFVINVNEPKYQTETEKKMQVNTFGKLNKFLGLSFNIFEDSCSLDFLPDLIRDFRLKPRIRLGLAAPITGRENKFLPIESYPSIAKKILKLSDRCRDDSIEFGFDCGFPMCIFSDEEIGRLFKNKAFLMFVCDPVLDIDPDLNVIHCYPLSGFQSLKLKDFDSVQELHARFKTLISKYDRQKGIYPECLNCLYRKSGRCNGGCKGHYLSLDSIEPDS
jgi:sulfatase maturation enzyme AslB (radical SAM superfamily)